MIYIVVIQDAYKIHALLEQRVMELIKRNRILFYITQLRCMDSFLYFMK